jgi:hypothetical protein
MNSKIRSNVINGDEGGGFVSGSRELLPGELERLAGPVVAPEKGADKPKHEPAFTPPQDAPAVPRDEHHGKGGMYVMVDGKRVPADDDGNPLPKGKK